VAAGVWGISSRAAWAVLVVQAALTYLCRLQTHSNPAGRPIEQGKRAPIKNAACKTLNAASTK